MHYLHKNIKAQLEPVALHPVFHNMNEAVAIYTVVYDQQQQPLDYVIEDVNATYERDFDLDRQQLVGQLASKVFKSQQVLFLREFAEVTETLKPKTLVKYFPLLKRCFEINVVPLYKGAFVTICKDITSAKKNELLLRQAYTTNYLTGLPNYRKFIQYLSHIYKTNTASFYLIQIAIQKLDEISHLYGKKTRDTIIKNVAQQIKNFQKSVSPKIGITTTNEGPGSFFIIINSTDEYNIVLLKELLDNLYNENKKKLHLKTAIGYCASTEATTAQDLILRTDIALQESMLTKKYNTVKATPELLNQKLDEQTFTEDVQRAIFRNKGTEIFVYFQPKKSPDGKLRGMEALVRWRRNGVIQNTQKFVDTVERLGRSEALFIIVMSRVVKHMRQWITHKKKLVPVSINIAPSQLSRVQTLPIIQSNIEKYAIAPHLLEFEITEGEFIQHYADAQLLLSQLQELGCAVSCDDFGVGYSDLKELANLSFNTIKFDRSWLKAIENSPKRIKLIEGLITIIHQQGSAVLFEGVETVQELNLLKQLAVDYIQGFHFSKPLPAEEMESQLPGLVPNWSVSGSSAQQYGKKQKTKNTDNCRAGG